MDTFEGTPLWENLNDLTSEFSHFNLVIRLSQGKQLALFRFSPCRSNGLTACRCYRASPFFVRVLPSHALETTFFNFARETDTVKQHETRFEASGMSPSCRYGPFGIW
jgi:hypothetical protein